MSTTRKKIGAIIILSIWFLTSSFTTLYALEDQFEVRLTVTPPSDLIAPSIPTGLSAIAVSSSQINLAWTASTDNVAVTGYRIYRDTVFVTTVTATNFSDIGLSANTLYSYRVSAVDAATNESAQSASTSATTFTAPVSQQNNSGGNGGGSQINAPVIYDVVVVPTQNTATITWKTTQPTAGNLSWGITSSFETGIDVQVIFQTSHSVTITQLVAGTDYNFTITGQNGYGRNTNYTNRFKTSVITQEFPNPTNFVAKSTAENIDLTWNNPRNQDFEEVRIVRGDGFFPNDPSDGQVVYEGNGDSFTDSDTEIGKTYFYTIFARYQGGDYSSGSVSKARIRLPGDPVTPTDDGIYESLPESPSVDPIIEALTFLDFDFIQNGRKISAFNDGDKVAIDGNLNLTVSLDYKKVPEILKSMVVTLSYPDDPTRTFSFLLRVNKEKTLYTATIGALGQSGTYGVNIAIVDYQNRGMKKIVGGLVANVFQAYGEDRKFVAMIREILFNVLLLVILLMIIYKALKVVFQKKKDVARNNIHEGIY